MIIRNIPTTIDFLIQLNFANGQTNLLIINKRILVGSEAKGRYKLLQLIKSAQIKYAQKNFNLF